jgi:hypothetical protein
MKAKTRVAFEHHRDVVRSSSVRVGIKMCRENQRVRGVVHCDNVEDIPLAVVDPGLREERQIPSLVIRPQPRNQQVPGNIVNSRAGLRQTDVARITRHEFQMCIEPETG